MLSIGLLFVGVALLLTALATLDIVFGMGWGYPWFAIPMGIGMAVCGAVFFRFSDRFVRAIAHIAN